jgi:hypothetical protein
MNSARTMKLVGLGVLTLAAVAAAARVARAEDAKLFPGAICAPAAWNAHISRDNTTGAVTVDHQSDLWCPLLGDSETTYAGMTAVVSVGESFGTFPGDTVSRTTCTLSSFGLLDGTPYDSSTKSMAADGQSTMPTLSLTKTTAPVPVNARYILHCTLTGGSSLYQYSVVEK